MNRKKVYISLPITGHNIKDVEKRCKSASELIEQLGFEAVSPLEVSSNPDASYEEHIGRDITALLQCDAVIFLEGWHYSNGCSLEHSAAGIYEKERLFSIGELKRYAKETMYGV
ncbi:DUF4406 domain-containing protein [Bacteroides clarus]|jgi:hypothetical protein|uniref:DUF4406 domain-containing protein n=1 Tax=Bacteroides clarus TaxID=626929 RepID=UPI0011DCE920|nr:DUF4406 domain-containing protein [Bacteroides clarus]